MAEPSEMRGRLARLRAQLADELPLLEALGSEVSERGGDVADEVADSPTLAVTAVKLHRYYTALESVLLRIERTLAAEPAGGDWHLELLRGATRELPGIRPAILPRAVLDDLHEVARFRHFFRHAYAVALDGGKLARVVERVAAVHGDVDASLRRFDELLGELAARLDDPE